MELREALLQIDDIRDRIARAGRFRGWKSPFVAGTGLVGVAIAGVQAACLPQATARPLDWLRLWTVTAAACIAAAVWHLWRGTRAERGTVPAGAARRAAARFAPCVALGGLLTLLLACTAPDVLWMLPGLWAFLFALGVFASADLLPRPILLVAGWYVAAGALCLVFARGDAACSPWAMGATFGGGQILCAAVLYFALERPDGPTSDEH